MTPNDPNVLTLKTLQRLMAQAKQADLDVHNVARSLLKPDTQVIFKRNGNVFLARVVAVIGSPGRTRLTVEKLSTLKRLDVALEDITGIVQS